MILPAILLALAQPADPAPTPPAPPAKLPTGKYAVLKVRGDLDADLYLRSIAAELDRLRDNSLIILELDGNSARLDLVARLGARIATNAPPVAVFLKDAADKQVGVGQALLGGFVQVCFIDPATRIASSSDDDLRALAPADISWEPIEQQITGPLWRRLTADNADQSLPQLLLHPVRNTWALPGRPAEPWKLSPSSPAAGQAGPQPRQVAWIESPRIDIDAETAVGLRLCAGEARSMAPILIASNLSPRSSASRRTIESGLDNAARTIPRILDDAKLALRRIAATLTIRATDHTPTVDEYRRAAQSALAQIDTASRELERVESLLADYPELSRRPSPDSSSGTRTGPWRPTIESIRKDLDKHRTTARDFASR